MSTGYQGINMVAQLGNDPSVEAQQQLAALAPAHAIALAQQQQLPAFEQLACESKHWAE